MGLKSTFQSAADTIFSALDDIPYTATYKGSPTIDFYDTDTGDRILVSTQTSLQIILGTFRRNELENNDIRISDRKGWIKQSAISHTPAIGDTILIGSDTWRVEDFWGDPADATWKFQLRKQ
jgi:hypothetical protein